MQILELIDQLDNLVYEAKAMPFGTSVRIDPVVIFELLDQMRTVAGEVETRQTLAGDEDDAQESSEGLQRVAETLDALHEGGRAVPPPLTKVASDRVKEIIETAEQAAAELRSEAEQEVARTVEEAQSLIAKAKETREKAESDAAELMAEAGEAKERAEIDAGKILARAERIRTETAASAAQMAQEQVKRMDRAAAELELSAGRAGADLDELLDKLRGPAAELMDILGPASVALRARVETLNSRVAAADAPLRGLGADAAAAAESTAEPMAEELTESAETGDGVDFSFEGLPGAADRVRAARVEVNDSGVADSDDPTDPPEFELDELWSGGSA
ncbi:MAG: hypothetical protein QOG62_696 [Thermoleophilaceae bacterium]|nr:hypothetical protein [Thermoleophilaceae bacterium]